MRQKIAKMLNGEIENMLSQRDIIIWGAADTGEACYKWLTEKKLYSKVIAFIDSDEKKQEKPLKIGGGEIPVYAPDFLSKYDITNTVVIIAVTCRWEVYSYIETLSKNPIFFGEWREPYMDSRPKKILEDEELFAIYQDDITSKSAIEVLQLSRREPFDVLILPYHAEIINYMPKYFDYWDNEEVSLNRWDEITLIDGGAYTGDTIEQLMQIYPDKLSKIYAFEPEQKNFEGLKRTVDNNKIAGIAKLFKKGMWNANTKVHFSGGEKATHINDEEGGLMLSVAMIDDVITDVKGKLCIKMDIEGAELQALEGAKNTIQRHKPELAICVYHKSEDVLTIPTYIKSLCSEYKCILRGGSHMTCYASVERF